MTCVLDLNGSIMPSAELLTGMAYKPLPSTSTKGGGTFSRRRQLTRISKSSDFTGPQELAWKMKSHTAGPSFDEHTRIDKIKGRIPILRRFQGELQGTIRVTAFYNDRFEYYEFPVPNALIPVFAIFEKD